MFHYYIPFLVVAGPIVRPGRTFLERPSAIETPEDVLSVQATIEREGNLPENSVFILDWKRLQ